MRRPESPTLRILGFLAAIERHGGMFRASEGKSLFGLKHERNAYADIHSLVDSRYLDNYEYGRYRLTNKGREVLGKAREVIA